jgi:hypothetical protein
MRDVTPTVDAKPFGKITKTGLLGRFRISERKLEWVLSATLAKFPPDSLLPQVESPQWPSSLSVPFFVRSAPPYVGAHPIGAPPGAALWTRTKSPNPSSTQRR